MPRASRAAAGGFCYHVLNRGDARAEVFHKDGDYDAFIKIIAEASLRNPMRVLAYCLMSNHFHLALWPAKDGDVSRWMHWLLTTHVRRYKRHYHSSGHIWQGRFKAFPVQEDDHLRAVLRYVERNPLRAALVERAEDGTWSSLHGASAGVTALIRVDAGPAPRGDGCQSSGDTIPNSAAFPWGRVSGVSRSGPDSAPATPERPRRPVGAQCARGSEGVSALLP